MLEWFIGIWWLIVLGDDSNFNSLGWLSRKMYLLFCLALETEWKSKSVTDFMMIYRGKALDWRVSVLQSFSITD